MYFYFISINIKILFSKPTVMSVLLFIDTFLKNKCKVWNVKYKT